MIHVTEDLFLPRMEFSHHVWIFPILILFPRPEFTAYLMQKNAVGGRKNIFLTAEEIIRRM